MISHIAVVLSWFSSFTWTKTLTLTLIKTLTPMLKKNSTIYTRTSKRNVLMMQYCVSGTRRRQLLESWETYKSTRGNANDWLYPNYIHVIKKVVCCVGSIEIRAECVGRLPKYLYKRGQTFLSDETLNLGFLWVFRQYMMHQPCNIFKSYPLVRSLTCRRLEPVECIRLTFNREFILIRINRRYIMYIYIYILYIATLLV